MNPDRAPSLVHSSASTAPPSTITALASHCSSFWRSQPTTLVSRPACPPAAEFARPLSAFHLVIPACTVKRQLAHGWVSDPGSLRVWVRV